MPASLQQAPNIPRERVTDRSAAASAHNRRVMTMTKAERFQRVLAKMG
jgi:hypothetical protein